MAWHEVKSVFGVLGTKKDRRGDVCEVRLCKVSWSGSAPMWDLRMWSKEEDPLKGITLTDEMMRNLKEILMTTEI